jgi:MiaB-like tRNA modifying enzyme
MPRIKLITYGCSLNKFDSELLAGYLKGKGYTVIDSINDADYVIINSCGVKHATEEKIINFANKLALSKKVIIGGCLSKITDLKKRVPNIFGFFCPNSIFKVHEIIDLRKSQIISSKNVSKLNKPLDRFSKSIAIIPISVGCMGNCTYCAVKLARGKLHSYPRSEIIHEVKRAVDKGYKELWLTAQDIACWGLDRGETLPELLNDILAIEGDFRLRLGMGNPNYFLRYIDKLKSIIKDSRVFKFLHIPVQSGANRILKLMGRKYTVGDFKQLVKEFKKEHVLIATDIICGFPTETEDEFLSSLHLIKEIKPAVLNISKYGPRPNTPASKLPLLPGHIVKQRSRRLTKAFEKISLKLNQQYLGWQGRVIISEKGKYGVWIGRTDTYRPVVIRDKRNLLNLFVTVRITRAEKYFLEGRLVNI